MDLFLRKVTKNGVQLNVPMGSEGYTLIHREVNEKEFKEMKGDYEDCIYAFIICCGGATILALSNKQKSYVMTEGGRTYANVSQR